MSKLNRVLVTGICLFASLQAEAASKTPGSPVCRSLFALAEIPNQPLATRAPEFAPPVGFRKGPDLWLAFRGNAFHYWSWLRDRHSAQTAPPQAAPLLAHLGIVTGDAHILNFDDVPTPSKLRKIAFIDFDDGSLSSSLFGDIIRLGVANRILDYRMKSKRLWKAYLAGLKGEEDSNSIEDLLYRSNNDVRDLEADYLADQAKDGKLKIKSKMQRIANASPELQALYLEVGPSFESFLAKSLPQSTVVDLAIKVKSDGGSQGLPRFVYLLSDPARSTGFRVIEFKMAIEPAADRFSQSISDPIVRFQKIYETYVGFEMDAVFDWLVIGNYQFHAREKMPTVLEFDPDKINPRNRVDDGRMVFSHIAWSIGRAHQKQSGGQSLLREIQADPTAAERSFAFMVKEYIKSLKKLNN